MEKLVYGGEGLARLDGRVVMAPFVLPGEAVRLAVTREKPGLVRARVEEILSPSPLRVPAPCPYFQRCGGCHYQHAPYAYQLQAKRDILLEVLRRTGKFDPPEEIAVVAGDPWQYRNRAQFHIRDGRLGYLEAHSHKLCAIDCCPISSPKLNEVIGELNSMLHDRRWPRFVRVIEVFTDENQVQLNVTQSDQPVARRFFEWCAERIAGWTPTALNYAVAGEVFQVSRHSFFQVNRFLIESLAETALESAGGDSALDLYAGVGLFSVPLARRFRSVTAVESGASGVRDLIANGFRAGVEINTVHSAADAFLSSLDQSPDFVLLDPPRAGVDKAVVSRLIALAPPSIAIVACDPATLARDLAGLLAGGYRIEAIAMLDLFPQTYHLETVVRLAR